MRRRVPVLVGLGVLGVVVLVLVLGEGRGDRGGGDDRAAGTTAPGVDPGDLPAGPARDLLALAERGDDVTHHATYVETGGDRFEVWVDGDRAREDVIPAGGSRRAVIRSGGAMRRCVEGDAGWECDELAEVPPGVQGRLSRLAPELAGVAVAERADRIAGLDVRCFDVASPDAPVQICLTAEGVLARLQIDDQRLELEDLSTEVDDDAFEVAAG